MEIQGFKKASKSRVFEKRGSRRKDEGERIKAKEFENKELSWRELWRGSSEMREDG
jgi:hypothetical protein